MNNKQTRLSQQRVELNRRQFFASQVLASTGILGASSTFATAPNNESRSDAVFCKLALKYHMIQVGDTPKEKLTVASRAGFDGVELSMRDASDAQSIRRAADEIGIVIHGLSHGTDDNYDPPMRMCKAVAGDAVLVIAKEHAGQTYEQNFAMAQQFVRRSLPLAEQLGIRLLIENVRASFLKEAEEMARFIDSFDSPFVGAYYDTGNAITWTQQSAEHWARVLGLRIGKVDMKDRGHHQFGDKKLKRQDAVGTDGGEVHWKNVRAELSNVNYTGWATAEVAGGDEERLTAMSAWMRSVLGMPA